VLGSRLAFVRRTEEAAVKLASELEQGSVGDPLIPETRLP
jgi:hypothetical protein